MSWFRYISILTACIIADLHSISQTISAEKFKRCPVKVINFEQGLLNNITTGIVTDALGFTWVSTRKGLQRFNGYSLDNINPVVGNDTILINSPVYLFALQNGNVWISYKQGVLIYDPYSRSFKKFISSPVSDNSFFQIVPLSETNEGIWCMQKNMGIVIYKRFENRYTTVSPINMNDIINSQDIITRSIIAVNKKNIFIRATDSRVLQINIDSHKFNYIDSYKNILGIGCNDESLFLAAGAELLAINIITGNIVNKFFYKKILKYGFLINCCIQPENNDKIIFSLNGQLYIFDGKLKYQYELTALNEDPILPSESVHHMYIDRFKRIWVLADNDIRVIQNLNISFGYYKYKNAVSNIVRTMYFDTETKNIFVGCISLQNGAGGGIKLFDTSGKQLWSKPLATDLLKNINAIEKLMPGYYLVVTFDRQGWYLMNPEKKTIAAFRINASPQIQSQLLATVWPNNNQRINDSTILIASSINVYQLIFKKLALMSVKPLLPFNGSGENFINCFIYTSNKNLWAGTNLGYIYRYQPTGMLQTIIIPGNYIVRCFAEDKNQNVWIGTDKGIYVYTNSGQFLRTINIESGMLNDYIYAMLPVDQDEAVFCSTKMGLSYVPLKGLIKNYTKELGLQENEFNTESAIKIPSGKFYFGGVNGITAFYPYNLPDLKDSPILNLTRLTINDSPYLFSSFTWRNDSIILKYNQNHLQFDVAALGPLNADEYEYKYRIKNFEEKWHTTHTPTGIKYLLQPGNYSLEITCTPIFSPQSITKKIITISIVPPWWETWWFRVGLGIIILTLIVLLLQQYNRKKYRKKIRSLEMQQEIQHERERISRDLHDNLGAYAASIASNIDHIKILSNDHNSETALEELHNNSRSIVSQLGDTIWALKKDALSLTAISDRIKVFIQRLQPSYPDIKMELSEQIETDPILPSSQAFHLLQIIQEAIINAAKHSGCDQVIVFFNAIGEWNVIISDNGTGIAEQVFQKKDGNGLSNMSIRAEESGWKIYWKENSPHGTSVTIESGTTN